MAENKKERSRAANAEADKRPVEDVDLIRLLVPMHQKWMLPEVECLVKNATCHPGCSTAWLFSVTRLPVVDGT